MDLYHYGDRELWYAEADDKSWSLPVFVEWKADLKEETHYGLVMPAVCFYHSQLLVMRALLDHHDLQKSENRWLLPKQMVEILLRKAPGITPAYHYKWTEDNHPPFPASWKPLNIPKPYSDPEPMGDRTFAQYVANEYHIQSSIVALVLKAVGKCAPKWMVEHRKPLELGFCTMIAAPFRANWKEIVAFKVRKWKLIGMFNLPRQEREQALLDSGIPSVLCSPHNIAIKKNSISSGSYHIDYTIEVIPHQGFKRAAMEVEGKRMACGNSSYVRSFEKTVEALYPHLLAALENYLRKTSMSFARLYEGGKRSFVRFLPSNRRSTRVRGVGLGKLPVHIITPESAFSAESEEDTATRVRAEAPPLSAVPTLPPAPDDVREREEPGDMDESRQGGTNGVPLLHAGEGAP